MERAEDLINIYIYIYIYIYTETKIIYFSCKIMLLISSNIALFLCSVNNLFKNLQCKNKFNKSKFIFVHKILALNSATENALFISLYRKQIHPSCQKKKNIYIYIYIYIFFVLETIFCVSYTFLSISWRQKYFSLEQLSLNLIHCAVGFALFLADGQTVGET
jgi:hypothetical protein